MDHELYKNLVNLLKVFQNKPNQLAKFLCESDGLTKNFQNKIKNSSHLQKLDELDLVPHFSTIDDLNDYYNSILTGVSENNSKNRDDLHKELLNKIQVAIDAENYEEAARIRDYMIKNNFKRN